MPNSKRKCSVSYVECAGNCSLKLECEHVEESGLRASGAAASNRPQTSSFFDEEFAVEPFLKPLVIRIFLHLDRSVHQELMEALDATLMTVNWTVSGIRTYPGIAFFGRMRIGAANQDAVHKRSTNAFSGVIWFDIELDYSGEAGSARMVAAVAVVIKISVSKADHLFSIVGATVFGCWALNGNNEWKTLFTRISQDSFHPLLRYRGLILGNDCVQDVVIID